MTTLWPYFGHISGPIFVGSREKFWARGGPKSSILAIFGHFMGFWGPPQNPEISGKFPSGFTAVWGAKKCRYPLFKILAAFECNRKSRIFRFLRESAKFRHFGTIFGPIFGHFWPFSGILGKNVILGGPEKDPPGERKKKTPFRVPPSPWEGPRNMLWGQHQIMLVSMRKIIYGREGSHK